MDHYDRFTELLVKHSELRKKYDEFGRFTDPRAVVREGHFTDHEKLVRDYARLKTKYERTRRAVRVLNRVLRQRRYERQTKNYAHLLRITEELTWVVGKMVTQTPTFTWLRFDSREEYLEYAEWKRKRKKT